MSAVLENIRLDSEAQREAEKKDVSPSTMSAASTASVNGKGGKNGHGMFFCTGRKDEG